MNCTLETTTTYDGKKLNGVFFNPGKRNKKALLYVHGFYGHSEILNALSDKFDKLGYGLACFDVRGYDKIEIGGIKKSADLREFQNCIFDIEAGIKFLLIKGFSEIIIAGISGGANKAVYYLSGLHNKAVKGLILLSPVLEGPEFKSAPMPGIRNDFENLKQKLSASIRKIKKAIFPAPKKIDLAPGYNNKNDNKTQAKQWKPDYDEKTFYESPRPQFNALAKIKEPILVVFGAKGIYLGRDAQSIIETFKQKAKSTQRFDSAIISGVEHNFSNKEQELAELITDWIKKI